MTLKIFNTLSREKEDFVPYKAPFVGLYVCGPTVYGDAHLGHARPAITFDLLFRILKSLDYKVRYVRNITDVGHLENDADEGEDKIAKKARLESLEPMEVSQFYINRYHDAMAMLNILPPSIEPLASGHIIEQIEMIKRILDAGYAYLSNGSVYFDVQKYNADFKYGQLSGRNVEDMISGSRSLDGQSDKHSPLDFALWKKASPEHIMRWPSPWSDGFPGWHMECSAMSAKYLGEAFDIHGGGMDLMFPHHECELAQSHVACGEGSSAKYWVHNNMITINGQKMGKSLGNFITLEELFGGTHKLLEMAYSPMTIRFFILQAHYRSTLDFSNEALQSAAKGLERLMSAVATLGKITPSKSTSVDVTGFKEAAMAPLLDDLNSPVAIALLFDYVGTINSIYDGKESISASDLETFTKDFVYIVEELLGLKDEKSGDDGALVGGLIDMILSVRQSAKASKDWATSDQIRNALTELGVTVKDRKDGVDWELK